MPKATSFVKARDKAHAHLLRGFDTAMTRFGKVPLGHEILDARTMNKPFFNNIAGETAGIPVSDHVYAHPVHKKKGHKAHQSDKNKRAGIVVDPTAIDAATAGDQTSVDTMGGYGLTDIPNINSN